MRKSLTLIELIFTIVIIAAVFTVIPKMIYVSNKSLEFSKKEDAVFNMMAKIMDISLKEYDYNNTIYDDILLTGNSNILECNATSGYRVGSFIGSRNCKNGIYESAIPLNTGGEYSYIEGYNGVSEDTTYSGRVKYTMKIKVGYTAQWNKSAYSNGSLNFDFAKILQNTPYTDIKKVHIVISGNDKNISDISYDSANIGHIKINSIQW